MSPEDAALRKSIPTDYCCFEVARKQTEGKVLGKNVNGPIGGGVAIILRKCLQPMDMKLVHDQKTFEYVCVICSPTSTTRVLIVNIYRPGSDQVSSGFYSEFQRLLESLEIQNGRVIITGDLNIHFEDELDARKARMMMLIGAFGYTQHVRSSTHNKGGILDVVIIKMDLKLSTIFTYPPVVSDHGMVLVELNLLVNKSKVSVRKLIRNYRKMDKKTFREALNESDLCREDENFYSQFDVEQLFQIYDDTLSSLIDRFAPLREVNIRSRKLAWFDNECLNMKRKVRKLENKYRLMKDASSRKKWKLALKSKHDMFVQKEKSYWEFIISCESGNPKNLWKVMSKLLGKTERDQQMSENITAHQYLNYIVEKTESICSNTSGASKPTYGRTECRFDKFTLVEPSDIKKLISSSPAKTCELDPAPTFLVKEFGDMLLPHLCRM